jgi:RNA polymerase sigma factor (sigma-70 family)
VPSELRQLLNAPDDTAREIAWSGFLESYSPLLLHMARSLGGDYDAAMDRYSFMLSRLRRDDFKKLRGYSADGRAKFSTWLTVVARRLCLDYYRERCGRSRALNGGPLMASRRALVNGSSCAVDVAALPDLNGADPAADVCLGEIRAALSSALRDLEPADRLLLLHWFENGRSAGEIAALLGYATPFHVYRRVRNVCDRLRRRLEQRGIRESRP